ncbi:MAG: ABC transporter permease [Chloroflexi bacterium]|nr:MAG: ABC transporter permease [Chloroflexota bacterium]
MKQILAITRKELKGYFGSPMALIFIGAFLAVTLFVFFWVDAFFSRGIADVRPLFHWMPVLMIFLVAALTMRQWSEEQRSGTLEILLTLPVSTTRLVIGKFLAVVILVAIALALTIFLPLSVSLLGNLDWGPVAGGYLAAILLAGAYAAIGLFVSSRTDNQIVSLISTVFLGGLFYLVGSPGVTGLMGQNVGDVLRALGAGSRFESIERGVIDLRDLLYYLSLAGIFLTLNVLSLKAQGWSKGERTRARRTALSITSALLVLNMLFVNVWAYPLRGLRLDLTQQHEYSLSPATRAILENLQEPLFIRGYFSEKTHPLLAPLVPTVHDMLKEYQIASGGKVQLEIIDPAKDPDAEAEANQVYGIRPTPFQVTSRYETSVLNSYFDILIRYGDQTKVLNFQDLIEVRPNQSGTADVQLRNLEYDLTSAIKKTVYGFQSVDAVLASLDAPAELTLYLTPDTLPEQLSAVPDTIAQVANDIAAQSDGKLTYTVVDPTAADSPISPDDLYQNYGVQPYAVSLFSNDTYYLSMVLRVGDDGEVIYPSGDLSESDIRTALEASLKRFSHGFLQVVGLWTPPETPTQDVYGQPQQPLSTWNTVAQTLQQEYEVRPVDLTKGQVPGDVNVLVVVAPQAMTDVERYAIDQYLMRGGAVVVAAGNYALTPDQFGGGLAAREVTDGVRELLSSYGINVERSLVLDPQNEPFPVVVNRQVGNTQVQEIQAIQYPFFVDVQPGGMAKNNPLVSNLSSVTLNWTSPITIDEAQNANRDVTVLLQSSPDSWLVSGSASGVPNIQPDFHTYPDLGFPQEGQPQSYPLAVSVQGVFQSAFKGQPSPLEQQQTGDDDSANPQAVSGTIESSPEAARLVVVGSGEFLDDIVFTLSSRLTGERYLNNLKFLQNAVAWSTEDLDLLDIRARGTASRMLYPLSEKGQSFWEMVNYVLAILSLVVLGVVWNLRLKNEAPIELLEPETESAGEEEGAFKEEVEA